METNNSVKEVITIKDLQEILGGVSYTTATRVMRGVRRISDTLKIKGLIHRRDWEKYLQVRGESNGRT